jgi:hypothetical protein
MPVTYQQARHFCDVGYLKILDAIEPSLIAQLEEYIEEQHRCLESRSETSAQLKVYHLYKKNEELSASPDDQR